MADDHAMHAEATSPPGHRHDAQVGPFACPGCLKSASIATWLQSDDKELKDKASASGMRNLKVNPRKSIKPTISAIEEQRVTRYRKKEKLNRAGHLVSAEIKYWDYFLFSRTCLSCKTPIFTIC